VILKTGNMWDEPADLYFCTTNSTLTHDGRLVMGKGSAKEMCRRHGGIDKLFGIAVHTYGPRYGVLVQNYDSVLLGAFQTKYNWREPSSPDLIQYSTSKLLWICEHYDYTIFLPFPGIGCGGLTEDEVLPIISVLRDNVVIWRRS
jgi:hypothetical protein